MINALCLVKRDVILNLKRGYERGKRAQLLVLFVCDTYTKTKTCSETQSIVLSKEPLKHF